MRLAKIYGMLGLVALAVIASPVASAQDSGWYLGANLGKSKAKIDDARITSSLLGGGFTSVSISDRDSSTGYKIFGGYSFNKYFALEGGYFDLGKFGFTATTLPAGTLNGEAKFKGFNLDGVLSLPFTEKFSAFGRIGVNNAEAKDAFSGTGLVNVLDPDPSKRTTNIKYGAGLQYDFTKAFGMRVEMERFRVNDAVGNKGDIDLLSLGVLIRFGRTSSAPAPAPAPLPAPIEKAVLPPPPPPVLAPEPVMVVAPAKSEVYCTVLGLSFEIDKGEIQRDDKEKIKVLGTFMAKYPETTVVIEGHSDDIGTPLHNMALSQQRAQSTVDYLAEVHHIDRSRMRAIGFGSAHPIADNATEDGKRQNRRVDAIIACVKDYAGLKVAPARITMAMEIEFDPFKEEVLPAHRDDLRRVADFLKENPNTTAVVEGHTGKLPKTEKLAMEISQRRAQNVVNYLVDNFGIKRSRLSAEGFGKTRRFAYSSTPEGQQENRRVNIVITYPK